MCSSRWDTPIVGADSWALAVRTHTPTAAERTLGTRSERTTSPFGAVVWKISRSSRTVSINASGRAPALPAAPSGKAASARARPPRGASPAPIAPLHHVLGALGAAVLQLGDVQQ